MSSFISAAAFVLALLIPTIPNVDWRLDPAQTSLTFTLKKGNDVVEGRFTSIEAVLFFDEQNPEAGSVTARVKTESINTGIPMRDSHLRKSDFFDCENFPEAVFKSERFVRTASGYEAIGKLTMHGVTQEVTIPFTFQREGNGAWFNGTFTIDRTVFGIGGNGNGIGKEVTLTLKVRATASN